MMTWRDASGLAVREHRFEPAEEAFVERFLQPGMTVVDAGAHGGFYSLLARRIVGSGGRVIAFEPSPRDRRRLALNLRLNRFLDVRVIPAALGESEGETDFYVVHGLETGFGGRRRPHVAGRIRTIRVPLTTLDHSLERAGIVAVDLVKIDVEGGELAVLRGAERLLGNPRRPVILCEISDERSAAWGHRGRDVYDHLAAIGYAWFAVQDRGRLIHQPAAEAFHGNFVAVPPERVDMQGEDSDGG
jgi:FkbM family methyltransferase